jgi:NAD kinase
MLSHQPRIVLVTRKTPMQLVAERSGTLGQAKFLAHARHQSLDDLEQNHERFVAAIHLVQSAIPPEWRRVRVDRDELDRFLFEPDDFIVIVGQDGLVANAAKYLAGQLSVGINSDPQSYDGVLCVHQPPDMPALIQWFGHRSDSAYGIQERTMVLAQREDGQQLLALNEVFVGHRTHQSARYRLSVGARQERQSSSGVICSSGTGATGWARSVARQRGIEDRLPRPADPALTWFVREPFPSVSTSVSLDFGVLEGNQSLQVVSEMPDSGVVFADGIESDYLEFLTGQSVSLRVAPHRLKLVVRSGSVSAPPAPRAPSAQRRSRQGTRLFRAADK